MCITAKPSQNTETIASIMLNARRIGEEAERVALMLPLRQDEAFGSFYSY